MIEFQYSAPEHLEEAIDLLGRPGARALAGGTDLVVQMREKRREVRYVVDLKRIPALTSLEPEADGGLHIGAAMNVTAMCRRPELAAFPAIVQSSQMIGSYQIQNRASVGGNVCNASPSADAIPALICHGAQAEMAGPKGRRQMPIESLFVGPGRTRLDPQELLVAIKLPPPPPRSAGSYLRFTPRREMDIAVAGVGAWVRLDGEGKVIEARIAMAAVAPTPVRAPQAESRLRGERLSSALIEEAASGAARDATPISDTRGSAEYRRELIRTLTRRTLQDCARQLGLSVERP
ncbi:MAG TPA: xanthine dehydrogenase family protein subunit M [Stellaceae bacterium]|nr:xanthine dehydrogenase family protein subunit M [Stellaceae bacterium]